MFYCFHYIAITSYLCLFLVNISKKVFNENLTFHYNKGNFKMFNYLNIDLQVSALRAPKMFLTPLFL